MAAGSTGSRQLFHWEMGKSTEISCSNAGALPRRNSLACGARKCCGSQTPPSHAVANFYQQTSSRSGRVKTASSEYRDHLTPATITPGIQAAAAASRGRPDRSRGMLRRRCRSSGSAPCSPTPAISLLPHRDPYCFLPKHRRVPLPDHQIVHGRPGEVPTGSSESPGR